MAIHVLIGLDADARTRRLIQIYRKQLDADRRAGLLGRTLWLVPIQRAVREVEQRLLHASVESSAAQPVRPSVLVAPNIFTFDGFAEAILDQAGRDITPVSPAFRRMLLRRIVDTALAAGQLTYFRPIAGTSGFLDLVEGYIAELKREEAWPEVFEAITQAKRPRDRELLLIYREYQSVLLRRQLYDTEGRFWAAREALRRGNWGRFHHLTTVVVDGFTDFTRTQLDLLVDLHERAESIWLSLPGESGDERKSLFSRPTRSIERLAAQPDIRLESVSGDEKTAGFSAVRRHIARQLFRGPRQVEVANRADGLELIAVAGSTGELRAAAVRVKRLLNQGVRPEEIVVSTREPDVATRLCRYFDDSGIPAVASTAVPLSGLPSIRALVAALDVEIADWPFDDLLALLHNSCVSPQWPDWAPEASPVAVGRILRHYKQPGGRREILETLARRGQSAETGELPSAELTTALQVLRSLDQEFARLRDRQLLADWVDSTISLAGVLGLVPPLDWKTSSIEQQRLAWLGWDLFERSLYGLRRDEAADSGEAPQSLTLAQWRGILADLIAIETLPPQRPERGRVRILTPDQARQIDCRVLMIVGLSERSFPSPPRDDCFFSDAERAELHSRGLALPPHSGRRDEELLLFWSLVTRPRERLVLTWPLTDGKGTPFSSSPFVTALRGLFAPTTLPVQLNERLNPLPESDELLTHRDLRLAATSAALDGRAALFSRLATTPAYSSATSGLAAAMDLYTARFHQRGFTSYEGAFSEPAALARIRALFSGDHEFSASQLERFATCAFRFVMEQSGRIAPLFPPVEDTNPTRRGTLVHELLRRLHNELLEGESPSPPDRLAPRFRELVSEVLGERPGWSDLQAALWRVEHRVFHDWAEQYQSQWNQYEDLSSKLTIGRPQPAHLEVPFGTPRSGTDEETPFAAIEFHTSTGVIRIRGRIDRIDVSGDASQRRYVVIDYKSGGGKTPTLAEIESGRQLQLALYSLAVQRLGLVGPDATPWQLGYWNIAGDGLTPFRERPRVKAGALEDAVWDGLIRLLEEVVPRLVSRMRGGEFVVANVDKTCTSTCPLSTTCRVAEIRALPEGMQKRRHAILDAEARSESPF